MARGGSFPDVWNRGFGWRGGVERSSRLHPSLAQDLLASQLLRHALINKFADSFLLIRVHAVHAIHAILFICFFWVSPSFSVLFLWCFFKYETISRIA